MSCEIICCEVPEILSAVARDGGGGDGDDCPLRKLFSLLEQEGDIDAHRAGYLEKARRFADLYVDGTRFCCRIVHYVLRGYLLCMYTAIAFAPHCSGFDVVCLPPGNALVDGRSSAFPSSPFKGGKGVFLLSMFCRDGRGRQPLRE